MQQHHFAPIVLCSSLLVVFGGCDSSSRSSSDVRAPQRLQLAFTAMPASTEEGSTLAPIVVELRDEAGVVDPAPPREVTLRLVDATLGVTLDGTLTAPTIAGIATFAGVTVSGTGTGLRLQATALDATAATSDPFDVQPAVLELVIAQQPPAMLAPLQGFDVTVELRTRSGRVANWVDADVTLVASVQPDLLWHASGDTPRVVELIEVGATGPMVLATRMPTFPTGEILSASFHEALDALLLTDIGGHLVLANPTTGDECRFRNSATLSSNCRGVVLDTAGVAHTARSNNSDHRTVDLHSGLDTLVGTFVFDPPAFTLSGLNDMVARPADGAVFAIAKETSSAARRLVRVGLGTGALTDVGSLGLGFTTLAFTTGGTLYGVTADSAAPPETLFTIDPVTATVTQVGALGNGEDGEAIAALPRRLRGGTTVRAVAGVATFRNLWFEQLGHDYRITATSGTLAPSAPSSPVHVAGAVTPSVRVEFHHHESTVAENLPGGVAEIAVLLSGPVDHALPVLLSVDRTSTATIGGNEPDALMAGAFQIVIAPGETMHTIRIPIVDDTRPEPNETLVLTIRSANLATSIGPKATHTLTIVSDE